MGCGASAAVVTPSENECVALPEPEKTRVQQPPSDEPQKATSAELIDGKQVADRVLSEVRSAVAELDSAPMLVVVLVGSQPASLSYIKRKEAAATMCGIQTKLLRLEEATTQQCLQQEVGRLNEDAGVDGIIVQLPLPAHLDAQAALCGVSPAKDVDGFLPVNIGATAMHGHVPLHCPCTPQGCLHLIQSVGVPLRGKEACVIGASNIVGIPMGALLLKEGMTVTTCHIDTVNVAAHSRHADVLVVAVGKAGLVTQDWVKPGAIVIDVGINFVDDPTKKSGTRMVGDVDFEAVKGIAGYLTPVPGGVGPMTVAMLMKNTLEARRRRCN